MTTPAQPQLSPTPAAAVDAPSTALRCAVVVQRPVAGMAPMAGGGQRDGAGASHRREAVQFHRRRAVSKVSSDALSVGWAAGPALDETTLILARQL